MSFHEAIATRTPSHNGISAAPLGHLLCTRSSLNPNLRAGLADPRTAKLAIAASLGMPLARLTEEERAFIDAVLAETLERRAVLNRVMPRLRPGKEARC